MMRRLFLAGVLVVLAACQSDSERVQAARQIVGSDTVVLLSASWCGYCRKERADLVRWGIAFNEFDVENDPRGKDAYQVLGGGGVPITLIGQQRVVGYSPRIRKMIDAELDNHNNS